MKHSNSILFLTLAMALLAGCNSEQRPANTHRISFSGTNCYLVDGFGNKLTNIDLDKDSNVTLQLKGKDKSFTVPSLENVKLTTSDGKPFDGKFEYNEETGLIDIGLISDVTITAESKAAELLPVDYAKEVAVEESDFLEIDDVKSCELFDHPECQNLCYKVIFYDDTPFDIVIDGVAQTVVYDFKYEVIIDAVLGGIIQSTTESLNPGSKDDNGFVKDIGKDKIKAILRETFDLNDLDIYYMEYAFDDLENRKNDYYYVEYFNKKTTAEVLISASTGLIIDRSGTKFDQGEYLPVEDEFNMTKSLETPKVSASNEKVVRTTNTSKGKPIWIIAHKCNKNGAYFGHGDKEIKKAVDGGCNAVEIDINYRGKKDKAVPVVCHDGNWLTTHTSQTFEEFLTIPDLKSLSMIVLDTKHSFQLPRLVSIVHEMKKKTGYEYLKKIHFIYSVAKPADANVIAKDGKTVFQNIVQVLDEREGICVDQLSEPYTIERLYHSLKVGPNNERFERCVFGDGVTWGPRTMSVPEAVKEAVKIKNGKGTIDWKPHIKAVESWTAKTEKDVFTCLGIGRDDYNIDSLMVNDSLRAKATSLFSNSRLKGTYKATQSDYFF